MLAYGIDAACDRLSVAVVDSDTRALLAVRTASGKVKGATREQRVRDLHQAARTLLDELADDHPPALVLIEQPMGRTPNPVLMAGWAVITSAAVTVADRHGGIVAWENVSTWRKQIRLADRLAAQKAPKLTDRWKAAAMDAATEVGYTGSHIDEADAVCIALAGCVQLDSATVTRRAA